MDVFKKDFFWKAFPFLSPLEVSSIPSSSGSFWTLTIAFIYILHHFKHLPCVLSAHIWTSVTLWAGWASIPCAGPERMAPWMRFCNEAYFPPRARLLIHSRRSVGRLHMDGPMPDLITLQWGVRYTGWARTSSQHGTNHSISFQIYKTFTISLGWMWTLSTNTSASINRSILIE